MELNLTIKEQLIMPLLFPQRSDKMTQIICEDIQKKVEFSDEEKKKYGIEIISNGWKWDDTYNTTTFPIEFSESEITVLKEQSKRLDREKNITREMLSLIKKIDNL